MRKIYLLLILPFFFASLYYGLSQGGSTYSIFGIGDLIHNSSAVYDGLSETAIAVPSEHSINLVNPALWGKLTKSRIRGGYRFNQNLITNSQNRLYQNNGKVDALLYALAIDTSTGSSIVFGFNSYSTVNYLIAQNSTVSIADYELNVKDVYQGSGGISQAFFGASYRPINWLYIGALLSADFGTINTTANTYVYGTNASSAYTEKTDYFIGMGFRIGTLLELSNQIRFGAFIENHSPTKYTRSTHYIYELSIDTTFETSDKIHLPLAFGLGASVIIEKFLLCSDFKIYDFSNLTYNRSPRTKFKPESRFSVGLSRLPNKSLYAPFADRIAYNFGLYYKSLYVEIDNHSISEFGGSFGFEIPIVGSAIFDAGFVFGRRLPSLSSLPSEYFGKMILEISLGERWFVPFRRK